MGGGCVAQTRVGAIKVAAAHYGITPEEYLAHLAAEEKHCRVCKSWLLRSEFNKDLSRDDGLVPICARCSRVKTRKPRTRRPVAERFWEKVDKRGEDECWPWLGATDKKNGYGHFLVGTDGVGMTTAHRASYAFVHGWPSRDFDVDHLCRNRVCVNPKHLEAVPPIVNVRRGLNVDLKTHCVHGHPYIAENVTTQASGDGRRGRVCLICRRQRESASKDAAYWRAYNKRRTERDPTWRRKVSDG